MKAKLMLFCMLAVAAAYVNGDVSAIREKIAKEAENVVDSTYWAYTSSSCHGRDTNKCNCFVYEIGLKAGAVMPTHPGWRGGPLGAGKGGWGTASSLNYWTRVTSPQRGDIVAAHKYNVYHVGIYVGNGMTVSANDINVARKSWPFGSDYSDYSAHVYWRYNG